MWNALRIKIILKLKELRKKYRRPVQVPSIDLFVKKHMNGIVPGSDYLLKREQPLFFFDSNNREKYIDSINANFPEAARRAVTRADDAVEHIFDILGSGPTNLGKKINWHQDFISGKEWVPEHFSKITIVDPKDTSDVKIPWELSRLQQCTDLGRAYWLTEDETYLREFVSTVDDWESNNRVDCTVNWTCSMEVAIRAINIIWGLYFFSIKNSLSDCFIQNTLRLLYYHGLHIEQNLETIDNGANTNHLLSNYLGLFYIGILFPEFDRSRKWRQIACAGLETEITAEVMADGADYECSTSYHRLVTEIFMSAYILGKKNNFLFSETYKNRLKQMVQFSESLTPPSGQVSLVGDNDDGFIVKLSHDNPSSHAHLIELGSLLFSDFLPENIVQSEESIWYLSSKVSTNIQLHRKLSSIIFKKSGYAVARNRNMHLLFSASKMSEKYLGGHKHNDNLSFTLEINHIPYFIDPGTCCYTSDFDTRNKNRSVVSHNTVSIDSTEQNRFIENKLFYLLNDAKAEIDLFVNMKDMVIISGFHKGYQRLSDTITHRRTIVAYLSSRSIKILDEFTGKDKKEHTFETRFITPIESVAIDKDDTIKIKEYNSDALNLRMQSSITPEIQIDPSEYYPGYGMKKAAKTICFQQTSKLPMQNLTIITGSKNIEENRQKLITPDYRIMRLQNRIETLEQV